MQNAYEYETVCFRMAYSEWPNLKERIDEPKIQNSIQTFMNAFDEYSKQFEKCKTTNTNEDADACIELEWCGHDAAYKLMILVDNGKVNHPPLPPYAEWMRKKKYEEKIRNIVPVEKELPDDVLEIIRQYSKPAFVHFREYNQALHIFHLPLDYNKKLKKKIGDIAIREQIRICVEANDDYEKTNKIYLSDKTHDNEYIRDKSNWWASVSRDKFVALLNDTEFRMQGYAEWYFQDDIDNAWRDSDDYSHGDFDEEGNPLDFDEEGNPLEVQVFENEESKQESNDDTV
jgi:hypothetical protein